MDYYYLPAASSSDCSNFSSSSSSVITKTNNTNNMMNINGGGNRDKMKKKSTTAHHGGNDHQKSCSNKNRVMKLSTDPQSVAARERRHRISDRFKILQSLVPGGTKLDTVSMLEEAIQYVKFLKSQIWLHQTMINFGGDNDNLYYDHDPESGDVFQLPVHHGHPVDPPALHQQQALCYEQSSFLGSTSNTVLPSVPVLLPEYSYFQGHQEATVPDIEAYLKYFS